MLEASQIEKMSVAERFEAMERLWDTLRENAGNMASPEWHEQVLRSRKLRAQSGESKFLTLDQLKSRLRGTES